MLSEALSLELKHLSLYQLTIEAGIIFHTRQRKGEIMTLNDDHAAELYEITQDMTTTAGLPAYEISNHAAIGQECRHNLTYWQAGDWIGVGPGAHGRFAVVEPERDCVSRTATIIRRSPAGWLNSVRKLGHGIEKKETDKPQEWAHEIVMMGLRLKEGVDLRRYEALSGAPLSAKKITQMQDIGMISRDKDQLYVTDQGFMVLNAILAELLSD